MNLVIDEGNTLVKLYVFNYNNELEYQASVDALTTELLTNDLFNRFPMLQNGIMCTVRNTDQDIIAHLETRLKFFIPFGHQNAIPVENLYKTKETLGPDRLALVVGASTIYSGQNVLVIGCGTAITYDFINAKTEYLGGNISPGMEMRFKALNQFTKKLPLLAPVDDPVLIGATTSEAITSGVILGIAKEIDGFINELHLKYPQLKIILTGGDSLFFAKFLKNTIFVDSLVLAKGLNTILEYNLIHEKK